MDGNSIWTPVALLTFKLETDLLPWLNPNQPNWRSAVQLNFHLQSD